MPIYEYSHTGRRGKECEKQFDRLEGINDQPLANCPTCGHPVKRLISRPSKPIMNADKMSDKSLSRHGFTKYVKTGDGSYEKATGPDDTPPTLGGA